MTALIRKERKLIRYLNYGGVCDTCGGVVTIDEITGIEIFKNDILSIVFPIDDFSCPHCGANKFYFRIWKDLNVTKEFLEVKHARG